MTNIEKLADFIEQHKTSEKSADMFFLILTLALMDVEIEVVIE